MITRRATIRSLLVLPAIIKTPGLLMPIRPLIFRSEEVLIHVTAFTGRFEVGQIVTGPGFPTMKIVDIGFSDLSDLALHCIPQE